MKTTIKVNSKCKHYKKESKDMQKSICKSLERLSYRIQAEGGVVNKIYNNDAIVYDRINDEIFMIKTHCINNTQIRIVYSVENEDNNMIMYLIDYTNKKKNDKQYIKEMNDKFKDVGLNDLSFESVGLERLYYEM